MSIFDRFRKTKTIERKTPTIILEPRARSTKIRTAWDGAKVDNLVAGWIQTPEPINQQVERELRRLRSRSRQLAKNDPYVKRFLQLARTNIVGPSGFSFRSTAKRLNGNPDKTAADAITAEWNKATRPGALCARDKFSFIDMMNLAVDQLYRDGELLLMPSSGGDYGVKFAFVDPELLDVNHKAERGRNMVRMGVETDKVGRVQAYHLHSTDTTHAEYYTRGGKGYLRVPARRIIHVFRTEYVDQLRGYPHTAAAMLRLRMLNGYEEAELVGARGGAATMGFIIPGETGAGFEGEKTIVETDQWGEPLVSGAAAGPATIEAEAGSFHYLDAGADVKMFDPNHPNSAYPAFIKAVLRGIASGLGVSYNTLANDLEGVNFSSIRSGVLEDREAWKAAQEFIIEHLAVPMFNRWLESALLVGAIKLPRGLSLSAANVDRYRDCVFRGRRWPWVDPLKDLQANKMAIDERLRSRRDVIRESGGDPDEVWEEIREEQAELERLNIKPQAAAMPTQGIEDDDEEDEDEDGTGDEDDGDADG